MPRPKIDDFLSAPEHKEAREFLFGAIDARINAAIEARKKERDADKDKDKNKGGSGNFFDELFGE